MPPIASIRMTLHDPAPDNPKSGWLLLAYTLPPAPLSASQGQHGRELKPGDTRDEKYEEDYEGNGTERCASRIVALAIPPAWADAHETRSDMAATLTGAEGVSVPALYDLWRPGQVWMSGLHGEGRHSHRTLSVRGSGQDSRLEVTLQPIAREQADREARTAAWLVRPHGT